MLAPDLLAVDMDIENSARAFDQLGIDAELFLDRSRQTGGLGKIISLRAILDRNGHSCRSFQNAAPECEMRNEGKPTFRIQHSLFHIIG